MALEQAASFRSASLVNTRAWRRAELPASNAHGNARSIALAMAPLANGGGADGHRLLSPETLERAFEVQAAEVSRFVDTGDVDIEVLLGRDILSQCVLKIDGPAGAFSLHR